MKTITLDRDSEKLKHMDRVWELLEDGYKDFKGGLSQAEIIEDHPFYNMMSSVEDADVIIVDFKRCTVGIKYVEDMINAPIIFDSIHYAVAIKYVEDVDNAPIILARGINSTAIEIVEIAKKHGIYCLDDSELATHLYAETAQIGRSIPEIYYEAIAEILAYVYKYYKK